MDHKRTFSFVALGVALSFLVYVLPVLGARPNPRAGAPAASAPHPQGPVRAPDTAANTQYDTTWIDHPFSNYQPNAVLIVTPQHQRGHAYRMLNDHTIALRFLGTCGPLRIWTVPRCARAAFNILIPAAADQVLIHITTAENTIVNYTLLNDRPSTATRVLVVRYAHRQPRRRHATYDDRNIGYGTRHTMVIFNQDGAPMALNLAFNVLAVPPGPAAFVHTTRPITYGTTTPWWITPWRTEGQCPAVRHAQLEPPGSRASITTIQPGCTLSIGGPGRSPTRILWIWPPAGVHVLVASNWRYLPLVTSRFTGRVP